MNATNVLQRMANAYATCSSYRDTGVVRTLFLEAHGTRTVEKTFATAFIRPDRFRFEYREESDPHVVWRAGKTIRTKWPLLAIKKIVFSRGIVLRLGINLKFKSLNTALAGETGVSGGSAHTIPALLLPEEVKGRRLTDMTDVKRLQDTVLEGIECYQIVGKYAQQPRILWIEKETFCVRQMKKQLQLRHFQSETTTTYFPVLNGEIDQHLLAFEGGGPVLQSEPCKKR